MPRQKITLSLIENNECIWFGAYMTGYHWELSLALTLNLLSCHFFLNCVLSHSLFKGDTPCTCAGFAAGKKNKCIC